MVNSMKVNEIFGSDDSNGDEHQQKIARIMQSMQKQYGSSQRPSGPSPEEIQRRQEFNTKRQEVFKTVVEIAKSFTHDQFDQFVAVVDKQLPLASKMVDLQTIFNAHASGGQPDPWSDFGDNRQPGIGPTGQRNWTGD